MSNDVTALSIALTFSPTSSANLPRSLFSWFAKVTDLPKISPPSVSYTHLTLPTNVSRCRSRWWPGQ
nr:hypothetical protein [Pedobacter sp. ASV19]